jgi:hypothetical protein
MHKAICGSRRTAVVGRTFWPVDLMENAVAPNKGYEFRDEVASLLRASGFGAVEIEPKEKFKKVDARQFGKERRLMAQHDMRLKQRTTQAQ